MAEYLVEKGVPFRDAHEIVGKMVRYGLEKNKGFSQMKLEEFKQFSDQFDQEIFEILNLEKAIDGKKTLGGTARSTIKKAIQEAKERIKK